MRKFNHDRRGSYEIKWLLIDYLLYFTKKKIDIGKIIRQAEITINT